MRKLEWYHNKTKSDPVILTNREEADMEEDWHDIRNQREYRDSKIATWNWAGSVYNIVQNAQVSDDISNITLGWIRSYIDTGISQTTNGMPEFDYKAYGATDHTKEVLWSNIVEQKLEDSYYLAHQRTAITDAHVFGTGVMEVYQGTQYRTLRKMNKDGTFTERIVPDHRKPKCGVRAISPFRVTRNPNVTDPNEVGSCSKEEILGWNEFVVKYGRCLNVDGELKYKNLFMLGKASHVKITKYQDENRDVYRIYALTFGNENDGKSNIPPDDKLGLPIFDRPLKIHDEKDAKGEILRSMGLNIPGLCNLIFLPYADRLDDDYQSHAVFGAGLPEHMEGLDIFTQTAWNMTIDNFRMGNSVVIGIESNDGTVPDFDANTYYGGEFVNARVTSSTLGQDRTGNFQQMYDVIQGMAIPGTGINVNAISGDTSNTAFEFAQRIRANSERAETILRGWENAGLKRLGSLALSAALSELTTFDLEQISGKDVKEAKAHIRAGRATREDFEFDKNGKMTARRNRHSITMQGLREDFTNNKSRSFSVDSDNNTLVKDDTENFNRIPMAKEYVYPSWFIEGGVPFDVTATSKRMLVNRKIQDTTTIQVILQAALQGIQIDEEFASTFSFSKLFEAIMERTDFDEDIFLKSGSDKQIEMLREMMKQTDITPQSNAPIPQTGAAPPLQELNAQQPSAQSIGQASAPVSLTQAAQGTI